MINVFDSVPLFDLSKGVIISHILYEELYIHKNNTNILCADSVGINKKNIVYTRSIRPKTNIIKIC